MPRVIAKLTSIKSTHLTETCNTFGLKRITKTLQMAIVKTLITGHLNILLDSSKTWQAYLATITFSYFMGQLLEWGERGRGGNGVGVQQGGGEG